MDWGEGCVGGIEVYYTGGGRLGLRLGGIRDGVGLLRQSLLRGIARVRWIHGKDTQRMSVVLEPHFFIVTSMCLKAS